MEAIDPKSLREILIYDECTGKLVWRKRSPSMFTSTARRTAEHSCANWNSQFADKEAFTSDSGHGYKCGAIFGRNFYAHRVAWALTHAAWPKNKIDHINGDGTDNRLSNLREATDEQNARNTGISRNNTSGYKGVSLHSQMNKWVAQITVGRVQKHLGLFETALAAHEAYCAASKEFHQQYARQK